MIFRMLSVLLASISLEHVCSQCYYLYYLTAIENAIFDIRATTTDLISDCYAHFKWTQSMGNSISFCY